MDRIENATGGLADYVAVLSRRRWLVVLPLVLVPLVAVLVSLGEKPVYRATAQVLLSRQNAVADATNAYAGPYVDPNRVAATQSDVARSPELVRSVVAAAHVEGLTAADVAGGSTIFPEVGADLLDFSYEDGDPNVAARVATAYAREYTIFRRNLDTATLKSAIRNVTNRIDALRARGVKETSPLYTGLLDSQSKLETAATLQTQNAMLLKPATEGSKVSPKPKRNALLGLGLGLILGLVLAFCADALDRRVRSEGELEDALAMPFLGRLPPPPRKLAKTQGLVLLAEPRSIGAEAFRKLRTNIEFATLESDAQVLLVTSALEQEGKSTTAANLAVAYARAGRNVALVDLDLRRPFLHRFFHRGAQPGITDVLEGRVTMAAALREIVLPSPSGIRSNVVQAATSVGAGKLTFLPAGTSLSGDAVEAVDGEAIRTLMGDLRERFDFVIVDSPPTLAVGDTIVIAGAVDAFLIVIGKRGLPRAALDDLARQLETLRAPRLGFVLAGPLSGHYITGYYGYGVNEPRESDHAAARHAR